MKHLVEKRADLLAEIKEILATVEAEGRPLTDEEKARLDELKAEVEAIKQDLAKVEEARALTEVKEDKKEEVKEEDMEQRQLEVREMEEIRAFEDAIVKGDMRALVTSTTGAVLIPETVADKIVTKVREKSTLLEKVQLFNVNGDLRIPKEGTQLTATILTEGNSITDGNMSFETVTLKNYILATLQLVSKSLINRADTINVTEYVVERVADALATALEGYLINGTNSGQPQGLVGTNKSHTLATQGVISITDFIKAQAMSKAKVSDCMWIVNRTVLGQLRSMLDETGRPYLTNNVVDGYKDMLLGCPVEVSDSMPEFETSNTGSVLAYYVDPKALAVKVAKDMEIQVLQEKYADKYAVGVIGSMEVDAKIVDEDKIIKMVNA